MTQSRKSSTKILVGDFETTVFKGQTYTEVWASALVEIGTENVTILTGVEKTFDYLKSLDCNFFNALSALPAPVGSLADAPINYI